MLNLQEIAQRTLNLWTLNTPEDKAKMEDAREDIGNLLREVETLRLKLQVHETHARMDARRAARC